MATFNNNNNTGCCHCCTVVLSQCVRETCRRLTNVTAAQWCLWSAVTIRTFQYAVYPSIRTFQYALFDTQFTRSIRRYAVTQIRTLPTPLVIGLSEVYKTAWISFATFGTPIYLTKNMNSAFWLSEDELFLPCLHSLSHRPLLWPCCMLLQY